MQIRQGNKIVNTNIARTLVKYNKRLLDRKITKKNKIIGVDWLQLAFSGDINEDSPLYTLMNKRHFYDGNSVSVGSLDFVTKQKTGQFEFAVNVYHLNRLMGILYWMPKQKYWKHDLVHFKADNEALYNSKVHPSRFFSLLQRKLNLTFSHIVRYDLYIDFYRFNQRTTVQSLSNNIASGKIRKVGKQKKLHRHKGYMRNLDHMAQNIRKDRDTINFYSSNRTEDGITIGSRESGKYIRIYNKTKQMLHVPKPYIKAHWNANGMRLKEDVFRFEMELKSDFFRQLDGDYTIHQLFDKDFHVTLLEFACRKHFEFVYNDPGQQRVDRMRPYELFDFHELGLMPDFVYRLKRLKKKSEFVSKKSVMQSVRMAMLHYVKSFQSIGWMKYAYNLALKYGLVQQMEKKLEHWFKSFYDNLPRHFEFNLAKFEFDYFQCAKLGNPNKYAA